MAGASGVMECVPTLSVSVCQATHERRQFPVGLREKNKMPVIWHDAISEDSYRIMLQGVINDALERRKVFCRME
jgi:hypothetical protein